MTTPHPVGRLFLRARRPGLRVPTADVAFTAGVLVLLGGIEAAGRLTTGDPEDALLLLGLFLLFQGVRLRHRRAPLAWMSTVQARGRNAVAAFRRRVVVLGVDLRGGAPVPEGFPPLARLSIVLASLAVVLPALFPSVDPLAVRAVLRSGSAVVYLLLVGSAWALFLAGSYFLLFLTLALTHDGMVRAHTGPWPRSRRREFAAFAAWSLAILLAWIALPPWVSLWVHAACLLAAALGLLLPGGPDVPLLWKHAADGEPLRRTRWRLHVLSGTASIGFLIAGIVLFLHGSGPGVRDFEALRGVLPMTSSFGALFAWTGAAALLAWCVMVLRLHLLARFRDPARFSPTTAWIPNDLPAATRASVRSALGAGGIRVRFAPSPRNSTDVPVRVTASPQGARSRLPDGSVALNILAGDLASSGTRRRIVRRDEIRLRRLLVAGLETLFKKAQRRRFRQGTGFWVAPHLWFCIGLSRDEDERATDWKEGTFFLETVGPDYHRVFPLPVQAHAHRVLSSLELDLLFVEDGIPFPRFRRVLRTAFDLFDMLGEGGRAEEAHFTGIPGIRVLIHEFNIESPWRSRRRGYPEPDYESVGRARILHVFRDRGASESPVDVPTDRRGAPLLA